jgi:TonB family protein
VRNRTQITLVGLIVSDKRNIRKIFIVLISFFLLFGCSNKQKTIIIIEKIELPDNYAVPVGNILEEEIKCNIDSLIIPPEKPIRKVDSLFIKNEIQKSTFFEKLPKILNKEPIKYPNYFKNKYFKGIVILWVEVLANAKVGYIKVKKSFSPGPGHLDEAALKSVKQWEFSPALANGKPIACWLEIPIELKNKYEK